MICLLFIAPYIRTHLRNLVKYQEKRRFACFFSDNKNHVIRHVSLFTWLPDISEPNAILGLGSLIYFSSFGWTWFTVLVSLFSPHGLHVPLTSCFTAFLERGGMHSEVANKQTNTQKTDSQRHRCLLDLKPLSIPILQWALPFENSWTISLDSPPNFHLFACQSFCK